MKFSREKTKSIYLADTRLDNLFISEYMPIASGDHLKVYIYGQMCAEHELEISDKIIASQLGISEEKIDEAWEFWESAGAVRRLVNERGETVIDFLNLKEMFYGDNASGERKDGTGGCEETESVMEDKAVSEMYEKVESALGRSLSGQELQEIAGWISDTGASPAVILAAVRYSLERKKDSIRYIGKIVESWTKSGLVTEEDVNEYLSDNDRRHGRYRDVMNLLGLSRNPTRFETDMMDRWFDDYGFSMEKIREACAKTTGISNPNFNYIDKIVRAWKEEAAEAGTDVNEKTPVTMTVLNRYYDYLREKAEKEAEDRLREVYSKIPEIKKIDDEISSIGVRLSKALALRESKEDSKAMRAKMDTLREDRAYLLAENNFDIDYTEIRYACPKCSDTGINEMGGRCQCMQRRIREAEVWQKENGLES